MGLKRRDVLKTMGAVAASSALGRGTAMADRAAAADEPPRRRPNILVFLTDDHGQWLQQAYGNSEVHTPNINRLLSSGFGFTHAFHQGSWSGAVCLPSRTMLNSGLTAFHAERGIDEVHTWGRGNWGVDRMRAHSKAPSQAPGPHCLRQGPTPSIP